MKSLGEEYPDIEVRVYTTGVDTDYIPKYGAVTSSVLIINESEAVTDISKSTIRDAFERVSGKKS